MSIKDVTAEVQDVLMRFAQMYAIHVDSDVTVFDHVVAAVCTYLRDYHGVDTDDMIPDALRHTCE